MIFFTPHDRNKTIKRSNGIFSITGAQLRAARALIRWSAEDLAQKARIGVATVRRAEMRDDAPSTTVANIQAMRSALEEAGVEFIAANGGGPGVRLRMAHEPSDRVNHFE